MEKDMAGAFKVKVGDIFYPLQNRTYMVNMVKNDGTVFISPYNVILCVDLRELKAYLNGKYIGKINPLDLIRESLVRKEIIKDKLGGKTCLQYSNDSPTGTMYKISIETDKCIEDFRFDELVLYDENNKKYTTRDSRLAKNINFENNKCYYLLETFFHFGRI